MDDTSTHLRQLLKAKKDEIHVIENTSKLDEKAVAETVSLIASFLQSRSYFAIPATGARN